MPSSSSSRFFSSLSPFPQTYPRPTQRSCVLHGRRLWAVDDALSLDGLAVRRQQMPLSFSTRFFASLSPFPQTYAGPNAVELSTKAPYEALIQTASGFETKLSAI